MKNNSKKTNKQNTTRASVQANQSAQTQASGRKVSRRSKDDHRRILFSKKYVKMETRRALNGTDHGASYALARGTDLNRRFVAAFLALVFAISTMVIGLNFVTKAEDPAPASDKADSNLVLDKTITAETDGTYTLKLSAYAKGAVKNTTKQTPTDYILVVDQSGSMSTQDMPQAYKLADMPAGGWTYDDFQTNTEDDAEYYIKPNPNEETYYRVYRKWGDLFELVPRQSMYLSQVVDRRGLSWGQATENQEQNYNSQYYYRPASDPLIQTLEPDSQELWSDTNFYPVTITAKGGLATYYIKFAYTDKNNVDRTAKFYNGTPESTNTSYYTAGSSNRENSNAILYRNGISGDFVPGNTFLFGYSNINNAVIYHVDNNDLLGAGGVLFSNAQQPQIPRDKYTFANISSLTTGMYVQNPLFIRHVGYNGLAYRDSDGVEHVFAQTDYCNALGDPTKDEKGTIPFSDSSFPLYVADTSQKEKLTRLAAVKNALTSFVEQVALQKQDVVHPDGSITQEPVDHRIAIVGFSSAANNTSYNNTELLTGENLVISNNNGKQMRNATSADYGAALISARSSTDGTVNSKVSNAISALTASGGTQPEYGLEMAYNIFNNNYPQSTYGQGERNAVVIFFTDGRPGDQSTVNQYHEANDVVNQSYTIKRDIPNAQIYSVGMFGESDGNPLTKYEELTNWLGFSTTTKFLEKDRLLEDFSNATTREKDDYNSVNPSITTTGLNPNYRDYVTDYAENTYYPDFYKENATIASQTFRFNYGGAFGIGTRNIDIVGKVHSISGTFWRDALRNTEGYPRQQNDTIADYMTVVSSSYPNAQYFDKDPATSSTNKGWSTMTTAQKNATTYNNVVNAARGERGPGRYYYSASDTDSLTDIFETIADQTTVPAISTSAELYLQDIISSNFDVPSNPTITAKTYIGEQKEQGGDIKFFEVNRDGSDAYVDDLSANASFTNKTLTVTGFDYATNYIMWDKPAVKDPSTGAIITDIDQGKKLVVTISGLTPAAGSSLGMPLESNAVNSGIYQRIQDEDDLLLDEFVSPTITRYGYKLNVGSVDNAATFDIDYLLSPNSGVTSADHDEAILIRRGDATAAARYDTLTNNKLSVTNLGNDTANGVASTVYIEYITSHGEKETADPADFSLRSEVIPHTVQDGLTYYLGTGAGYLQPADQNDTTKIPSSGIHVDTMSTTPAAIDAFWINSTSDNKPVTITLDTERNQFIELDTEFTADVVLSGAGLDAAKVSDLNSQNNGKGVTFVWDADSNTATARITWTPFEGQNPKFTFDFGVPDGVTLSIIPTLPGNFSPGDPELSYTVGTSTEATTLDPTSNTLSIEDATHYVIKAIPQDIVVTGVTKDDETNHALLYILVGVITLSAGSGAAYVYRRKNKSMVH